MTVRAVTGRRVLSLTEGWQLALTAPGAVADPAALPPTLDWIPARVPGTAAQALRDAGRFSLETPTPLHDQDIWYRTRFAGTGRRTLHFEGLATIAEVFLNGQRLFASDNMFLVREADVDLVPNADGDNELAIVFRSLDKALEAKKGRARWRTRLVENNALRFVRTTLLGHMTGWQPAVHAVGPWRAIQLIEQALQLRVRATGLRASLDDDRGVLTVALEVEWQGSQPPATLQVGSESGPLKWTSDHHVEGTLVIPKVAKWWPHTHGKPVLHAVTVRLGEVEIDLGRIGFRKIELDRGADGKGFALKINGEPVFARGACWSASDLVSLAGDRAALLPWLEQMRQAHMNMVRVGGTMIYESDDFFSLCDELGLLVWHDFMFANMDYPIDDDAFRANVETEATQFLARTLSHPSLAVLCGGSEVAQQVAMMGLPHGLWSSPLYDELLQRIAATLRPDTIYVAHSPGEGDLPFSTDVGVSHYYGVGAYLRPLEDARRAHVRFTSECLAFANVPGIASPHVPWQDTTEDRALWKAAVPRDRGTDWDFEDVRDHYMRLLYAVDPAELRAADPARWRRLARATTAEVMETVVAEWRRPASACAGALVWMLKDFQPGAGWGVIDAAGLPKLAWHGLRRAFRPVQVTLTDEGLNGLGIHLVNETAAPIHGRLSLRCFINGATEVMHREREIELPARGGRTLASADLIGSFFDLTHAYRFGPPPCEATVVTFDEATSGTRFSEAIHFTSGRATLLADPGLSVELLHDEAGWALRLRALGLAPCIQIEDAHYHADDEGFFLMPGALRTVRLLPVGMTTVSPAPVISGGYGTVVVSAAKG